MSDTTKYINRTKKSRAKKLSDLTDEIMSENTKLTREQATQKAVDNIRKKNSAARQKLRLKKKGTVIIPKSNLNPFSEREIKKIKGKLPVESKNILDDDKKLFNSLTYAEQKLVNRMNRDRKTKTSMRSLVQYIQKVKQLYKKDNQTFNGSNISLLLDNKKTMNILESNYANSKDYLWSIINVLRAFPTTENDVKIYEAEMGKYLKKSKTEIRQNKKTEKQSRDWLSFNKVVELFKQNKNRLSDKDELLMKFVIYFPRRLQDWYKMKLHKSGNKNMNYNYLNINKFGFPSSFQFFRSKSSNYEQTTKKIPSKLKNIIMTYVREKKIKNNQLLFPKNNSDIHSADSFSKHITSLFKTITGKSINNNLWRHIVATNLSDKGYSMNQREKVAKEMGHGLLKNLEYVKK